jgi:hypothetical protein
MSVTRKATLRAQRASIAKRLPRLSWNELLLAQAKAWTGYELALERLMREPPGGDNFGFTRRDGRWIENDSTFDFDGFAVKKLVATGNPPGRPARGLSGEHLEHEINRRLNGRDADDYRAVIRPGRKSGAQVATRHELAALIHDLMNSRLVNTLALAGFFGCTRDAIWRLYDQGAKARRKSPKGERGSSPSLRPPVPVGAGGRP